MADQDYADMPPFFGDDDDRSGEPVDWVERGRAAKVAKLVAVIEENARLSGLDPYADAEEIARTLRIDTSDGAWLALQQRTGNKRKTPPSAETRALVVEVFAKRVDMAGESEDA